MIFTSYYQYMVRKDKMTNEEISCHRLLNQKIAKPDHTNSHDLVHWMGAVQAQDFAMAKWAVGLRLKNAILQDIEKAFNEGEIIRTHVMRPTWHLISAHDASWLLKLTAPQIKASMVSRNRELELTPGVFLKSALVIENRLREKKFLSREEIGAALIQAGIRTDENRLSHLLMEAELDEIICSGPIDSGKTTYALFSNRVRSPKKLSFEESLAGLASRYLQSHAPAQITDFIWWSGLPVRSAKLAYKLVSEHFEQKKINGEEFWCIPGQEILNFTKKYFYYLLMTNS
ncbi:MAG: winged helix DNA-binding domain-containing protein [Bacteroidales bacterium]|nr:winged helix DNA-binding domain-containing protein [Bacteroidales bacterium]